MAVQGSDNTSIVVSWTAPSNAIGYQIYYNISGGDNLTQTISGKWNNSVTLKDLPVGKYTVSVRAISGDHLPSAMERADGSITLGEPLLVTNISYMKLSLLG